MTEHFLQYLWNYKLFTKLDFRDTEGNALEILDFGKFNTNSGPDFSFAKLKTKNLLLAGNIELHLKSSDWKRHGHQNQVEYRNVILHVVYEHDEEVTDLINAGIPTLELRDWISENVLTRFWDLQKTGSFIPCEELFYPEAIAPIFSEQKVLEKLDEKSNEIEHLLKLNKNDYEAVLFQKIAYAFGLKVNAELFQQIAAAFPYTVFRKVARNPFQAEALLLGKAGLLQEENSQNARWRSEYNYLLKKYQLDSTVTWAKMMRLRPASFPTIRLSQLASLYANPAIFSTIINAQTPEDLTAVFMKVQASEFWTTHFSFNEKESSPRIKKLSADFIELILLNAVLPFIYTYNKNVNPDNTEFILNFYRHLRPEKNSVIKKWEKLGVKMNSALDSQAFLYHKKRYCDVKNCLNCSIGYQLMKHV